MQKKKLVAVVALILALFIVLAIIIANVGNHSEKEDSPAETTTVVEEESTTSLYGDVDPDEEDNIDIISKANTMRKKVTDQMEGLKTAGFGNTEYELKKAKLDDETCYQVYAGGAASNVYFFFDTNGPSVKCTASSELDVATMRAAVTTILYVCTPSIGDLNACAAVFDSMKESLEDMTTVTYNQNYTEYHYTVDGTTTTFSAMETQVVG